MAVSGAPHVQQSLPTALDLGDERAPQTGLRQDLALIASMVEPGSRVLDIGCGDGSLLAHLGHTRNVDARGMELSQRGVNACVRNGLSVIQGDADNDLEAYPDGAFDYVILSQTLQATRHPRDILHSLARIGRYAIVSFPNFGHWRVRMNLLATGRMPRTEALGANWWDTPNIHLCTIRDFIVLVKDLGLHIERGFILDHSGKPISVAADGWLANWLGEQGLFLLRHDQDR